MDARPYICKGVAKCEEGITHTLTGVYVMLTGVDTGGKNRHTSLVFRRSAIAKNKLFFGRAENN